LSIRASEERPAELAIAVVGLVWLSHAQWSLVWDPFGKDFVVWISAAGCAFLAWQWRAVAAGLRTGWPLLLLVGLALLSTEWSIKPSRTWRFANGLFVAWCFGAFLGIRLGLRGQVHAVALAFGGLCAVTIGMVIAVPDIAIMDTPLHRGPWRGPLQNRNGLAWVSLLATLACAVAALPKGRTRLPALIGLACSLAVTAGTRSRAAWILAPLLLGAIPLLRASDRIQGTSQRGRWMWAAVGGVALALAVASQAGRLLALVGRDLTFSGRAAVWQLGLEHALTRPWLGHGYGVFWRWTPHHREIVESLGYNTLHGHSTWLDLFLGLGVVGVATLLLGLVPLCLRAARLTLTSRAPEAQWPVLCLAVFLAGAMVESLLLGRTGGQWPLIVALSMLAGSGENPPRRDARPAAPE